MASIDSSGLRTIRLPTGEGIDIRHTRSCPTKLRDPNCPCGPTFRAWVFSRREGRKIRRSFPVYAEARKWRRDELRRMYSEKPQKGGRLDTGYSQIRKALQELDRALAESVPPTRAHVREAVEALYRAEDATLRALVGSAR